MTSIGTNPEASELLSPVSVVGNRHRQNRFCEQL